MLFERIGEVMADDILILIHNDTYRLHMQVLGSRFYDNASSVSDVELSVRNRHGKKHGNNQAAATDYRRAALALTDTT